MYTLKTLIYMTTTACAYALQISDAHIIYFLLYEQLSHSPSLDRSEFDADGSSRVKCSQKAAWHKSKYNLRQKQTKIPISAPIIANEPLLFIEILC